jgi:hypothetical protein
MSKHNRKAIVMPLLAATLSITAAYAAPLAERADYAGTIYNGYAASSGDRVSFDLSIAGHGRLADLADNSSELAVPDPTVAGFETGGFPGAGHPGAGHPVAEGHYRVLEVITTLGRDSKSHRAVEFCWENQFHCVLLDPGMEFIDSIASSQIKFMAEAA